MEIARVIRQELTKPLNVTSIDCAIDRAQHRIGKVKEQHRRQLFLVELFRIVRPRIRAGTYNWLWHIKKREALRMRSQYPANVRIVAPTNQRSNALSRFSINW